ncbi:MAG: hypothetical protein JW866_00600 [Ignavibacteriales bacterium]|nr:hypothetical protein [Ignavibacteriales bacterium]
MIGFYLSEALRAFKKAKLSTFITIITTMIAIIFTLSSLLLLVLSENLDKEIKDKIEINAFLENDLSSKKVSEIKDEILKNDFIKTVTFISKEEAEKKFIEDTGEDFKKILDFNPLPASYKIKLDADKIVDKKIDVLLEPISKIEGIEEIVYDYDFALELLNLIKSAKNIIYIISIILVILSIYLVYSTNRLVMHSKIEQYETMKFVGAKLSTLKIPIFIQGVIIGLLASLFCIGLFLGIIYLLSTFKIYFVYDTNFYLITGVIFIIGIIFGIIGSFLSSLKISLKIERF